MQIVMIEESKLNEMMDTINSIAAALATNKEKETYTVSEVAELKGISYQTAMSKVHSHEWKAKNISTKSVRPTYRIDRTEVQRILKG